MTAAFTSSEHPRPADSSTPIGAPLRVAGVSGARWDDECDVMVVGFGAAGACAAIEAARAGAKTIATDRFEGGGASAKSGGVVYAGGGTRHQKDAGYDDSPEAMYEYLSREVGDAVSPATLRAFCEQSVAMLEWLEGNGVKFDSSLPPRKTSYPPDGCYLYFSGNETVKEYAGSYPPAPRGHRVKGKGLSGALLYDALRRSAIDAGVRLVTQAAVRRLVIDNAGGAVLGAELWRLDHDPSAAARHRRFNRMAERLYYASRDLSDAMRRRALAVEMASARPSMVRARGGVVLSTGGFIFNREMVSRYAPAYLRNFRLGTSGCDGSGIRLGESAGGDSAHLDRISAWRFINPPLAWVRGVIVDERGERFCNEEVYGARLGHEMCLRHGGRAWLVIDSTIRREALREAIFGRLWGFQRIPALVLMLAGAKRGRTIEELASAIGADRTVMRNTLRIYNEAADRGEDSMGKSREFVRPLESPPFYALNIAADMSVFPCPAITLGGLRVDEQSGAVLDRKGARIEGLYAAGRAAVGIASNQYVSGLALADCVWSGRRAGRAAAAASRRLAKAESNRIVST